MKTYTITLPDEFAAFVDRAVAEKKFDSVDHLVLYAVAFVEDELRLEEQVDKDWLQREIQKGLDASARGEVAPMDMTAIWDRVKARLAREQELVHPGSDVDRPVK